MRKTLLLAVREYKAAVRSKAFLVMMTLMPVMMLGGITVMKLMEDRVDTTDRRIAVIDDSGVVAEALIAAAEARNAHEINDAETGKKIRPAFKIEIVTPDGSKRADQLLELSNRVRGRKLYGFVEIGKDVVHPDPDAGDAHIRYYSENALFDDTRGWMSSAINGRIRDLRLVEAGLDATHINELTSSVPVEGLGLVSIDEETGQVREAERSNEGRALGVPMGLMMMMFMVIAVGATPLINSVLEEKMQRIAEVLLGSARPFEVMMGKLLGSVGQSLTIVVIYASGAIAAAYYLDMAEYIPFAILPWFIVYLVAAILMFGAMFTAVGAACNDLKEAQSLMLPVWLVVMIPMFVWMPVLREPLSSMATWMSLIPPCTPLLMMIRQSAPVTIPAWQPWVGLVGVILFTALCVWGAGRVFRVGILMQGKPPSFSQMLRWALRG